MEQNWDDSSIKQFVESSETDVVCIQLQNAYTLWIYIQGTNKNKNTKNILHKISSKTWELLTWLGTPEGFQVHLLWIDKPRYIEANEWPSRETVNGGWTIPNTNTIYIYRKEEWDRVLIHEMIHALHWDWTMPSEPFPCWKFTGKDTVYPHIFEAWTELYAEWLWCGWHNQSWKDQRKWQTMQALQILARRTKQPNWSENTSIFAYYVLKAALAPHIEFLWAFGNGINETERSHVMCSLVTPVLDQYRRMAETIQPRAMSMRMTVKN